MSTIPPARPPGATDDAPLNPALKQVHDPSYGRDQSGTDPMETVSVKKNEGSYWPMVWAATAIICVVITMILLVF